MKHHLKAFSIVLAIAVISVFIFTEFIYPRFTVDRDSANLYNSIENFEKNGVPNFSYKDINNLEHELIKQKGKVIIINFWASWCGPCVEEVPSLVKLVKEFNGQVQLIAISGDSHLNDIEIFLKSFPELKGENISVVWDSDRNLMKQFGIAKLPESLIVNKEFKLAKKLSGSINWYTEDSRSYINHLLK